MSGTSFTGPLKIRKSDGSKVTVIDENGNIDAPVTTTDLTTTGNTTLGNATTDTVSISGSATVAGSLNYKAQVTDTGGAFATPIVLTADQSGRHILLDDAAGLDFTLPAIDAATVGTKFTFFLTTEVTSNSYRFTAQTGDLLSGHVVIYDKDVAEGSTEALLQVFRPDGSDDLIVTIAGADDTTGSLVGGWIEFTAITTTRWFVRGSLIGDGALATIFS